MAIQVLDSCCFSIATIQQDTTCVLSPTCSVCKIISLWDTTHTPFSQKNLHTSILWMSSCQTKTKKQVLQCVITVYYSNKDSTIGWQWKLLATRDFVRDWSSFALALPRYCDKKRTKRMQSSQSAGQFCSYPHLCLRRMGHAQKNESADESSWNEFPQEAG